MEQISIEQKMLMALLGAELAKNGKDFRADTRGCTGV